MAYVKQNFVSESTLYAAQLNSMDSAIAEHDEALETLSSLSDLAEPVISPINHTSIVNGSIYSVPEKKPYGEGHAGWAYAEYVVHGGDTLYITGRSGSVGTGYPVAAFWDANGGYRIAIIGDTANTGLTDEEVTVPSTAVKMIVNSTDTTNYPIAVKKSMNLNERITTVSDAAMAIGTLDGRMADVETRQENGFFPENMDGVILEAERNPFRFAPFDKGYVSFVWDDLRDVVDSMTSIFEEYGYPVCLAAIQTRMGVVASGISETRGSYTPGMYMFQICHKVEELGGEILAHNATVITLDNQYDYDTMYDYFRYTYQRLHDFWGMDVRGLIRAGGANQLGTSREIKRWVIGQYEYSNQWANEGWEESTDPKALHNHMVKRIDINSPLADVKAAIDDAVANKRWIVFFGHDYEYGGGVTLKDEDDLREILDYVEASGITVCTYKYIFDHFSSSVLGERIRALEEG